jgi:thiamine-phosphate diphosphorylase
VDVALAVGADGVHIGQSDMDFRDARRLLGPEALIGFRLKTMEQAAEAEGLGAAYYGVSPVFSTPTKTDTARSGGFDGLRRLRTVSRQVLVGIARHLGGERSGGNPCRCRRCRRGFGDLRSRGSGTGRQGITTPG